VGSAYFGGPYIYFLFRAAQEGYIYGIIGALAIIVTIVAIFYSNRYVQIAGLALMVLSLLVFFASGKLSNAYTFRQIVPFLTLALFIGVSIAISLKFARHLKK
jgi:hypothetical protein